ncbi:hypothetical protein ACIBEK_01435 [Nocardia fusca]
MPKGTGQPDVPARDRNPPSRRRDCRAPFDDFGSQTAQATP